MQISIAKGYSIRDPKTGDMLQSGVILAEGQLPSEDIKRLMQAGILVEHRPDEPSFSVRPERGAVVTEGEGEKEPNVTKGKWLKDPASLQGLSLEELLVLVNEIDPQFDLSTLDESSARKLLCSDFDPRFVEPVAPPAQSDDIAERARRAGAELAAKAKG